MLIAFLQAYPTPYVFLLRVLLGDIVYSGLSISLPYQAAVPSLTNCVYVEKNATSRLR